MIADSLIISLLCVEELNFEFQNKFFNMKGKSQDILGIWWLKCCRKILSEALLGVCWLQYKDTREVRNSRCGLWSQAERRKKF